MAVHSGGGKGAVAPPRNFQSKVNKDFDIHSHFKIVI